tara:strand:- start:23604 stop:25853 length:2250 start_codon:yes stop_codon:yes gene_type:complete
LLLWHWGRLGGGPRYTLELARALKDRPDIDLSISVSRQCELLGEFRALGVPLFEVDTYDGPLSAVMGTLRLPLQWRRFQAFLVKHDIDVVNSTMPHLWTRPLAPFIRRLNIRFVSTIHDAVRHKGEAGWLNRLLFPTVFPADAYLVLSDFVGKCLTDNGALPQSRIHRSRLGPLVAPSSPESTHTPWLVVGHGNPLRLLFFGRVLPYKGLDLLLEAYRNLRLEGRAVTLHIAGRGELGADIAATIASLPDVILDNRWIDEAEIPSVLSRADVLVAPYVEASQSGVIPAAFRAGLPVVATPVGGLVEQVRDGENGLIAAVASSDALLASLRRLCDEQALYQYLAKGARASADAEGSWQAIAADMALLVRRLAKPKILFVFPLALNLKAHWADRVRATAFAGVEVHVAVPMEPDLLKLDLGGAILHDWSLTRGYSAPLSIWRSFRIMQRLLSDIRPDLLHAVTIWPIIYAGWLARLVKVPALVCSVTGLGYIFTGARDERVVVRSIGIFAYRFVFGHKRLKAIFENGGDADFFVRLGLVKRPDCRVILGGGLDLTTYAFTPEPDGDQPIVVLPARMLADKGVREFAEAARILKLVGVSARFVLVGDIDPDNPATLERDEIEGWVRAGHLEWWGWREDMPQIMVSAAIVCLPSYREGAPRVLMEAAATGRVVVTTDVPGCRDVVRHERTGLVVPARDATALADAIGDLLSNPEVRRRMGQAAREHAEENFSSTIAIDRLFAVYDDLMPGWRD